MATIPGSIPYTGFIAPTDDTDTFPVTDPKWGLGGLRKVADLTERDAIAAARRELGMLVYVVAEDKYFTLKTGLTNSDWEEASFTSGLIPVTYAEASTLASSNELIPGQKYLLTDYQTIYDQPDFDGSGNLKGTLVLKTETVEPLILTAATDFSFHATVISTVHPKDRIQYDFTVDETFVSGSPCKGRIIERIDEWNNRTDYDHRTVKFIRYESSTGSGVYNQYKDNGEDTQEFLTFGNDYGDPDVIIRDNYIGNFWLFKDNWGFDLPNTVFHITDLMQNNYFRSEFANKVFGGTVQNNCFKDYGKDFANIFNYTTGNAPSLADFETQIGFSLINGHKFGDTIVFDNVGYDVGIDVFDSQNLTGYLKCSALNIASNGFQGNSIVDVYLPLCGFTAVTAFSSNNIERIYAPFLDVSLQSFGDNNIKYLNIPNISSIGETVGDDGVFFGNTGNTVNIFAPTVHQTSNSGGLEGDLAYLNANNTVTFHWGETEVPDWIKENEDFTQATHVSNYYYCEILRQPDTRASLSYFNGTNMVFVSPTS